MFSQSTSFTCNVQITPELDKMVREGVELTNFYVFKCVCSLSVCTCSLVHMHCALMFSDEQGMNNPTHC